MDICVDLDGIMLSEISQRKTNTVWSLLYVECKAYTQSKMKQAENKLIDTENGLVVARGGVGVGRNE